jgi:HAE1 family hydrophobic/amphiphilic exporter-1
LFSGIFIDRPRFATVIAVVITLADLIAIRSIPIQFPDIVPPQVTLTANYPGADPEVIENTVAQPIAPKNTYDAIYLSNYATINVIDPHPLS